MRGFTNNYIRVELPSSEAQEVFDNQLMRVRLGDFNHDRTALMVHNPSFIVSHTESEK